MVRLHNKDGEVIYINIDKINVVDASIYYPNITDINIGDGIYYSVTETPDEVAELIGEARCTRYVGLAYCIADELHNTGVGC